jgi:hypothetical protein
VLWSWHVTEFVAFADAAIEICDGTPTLVEGAGGTTPDGQICFWTYTVVLEIPPPEVALRQRTWGGIKELFRH